MINKRIIVGLSVLATKVQGDFRNFVDEIGNDIQRVAIEEANEGVFDDLKKLIDDTEKDLPWL